MSDQGSVYFAFIEAQLKNEHDRKSELSSRAASVITTSGGLVTLLAGVGAFVSKGDKFVLPHSAVVPLIVTLAAFALSAMVGIFGLVSRAYRIATPETMTEMRTNHWTDHETDARNIVALLNITTITTLRRANGKKVRLLTIAYSAQVLALIALSVVVFLILRTG